MIPLIELDECYKNIEGSILLLTQQLSVLLSDSTMFGSKEHSGYLTYVRAVFFCIGSFHKKIQTTKGKGEMKVYVVTSFFSICVDFFSIGEDVSKRRGKAKHQKNYFTRFHSTKKEKVIFCQLKALHSYKELH